MMASNSSNFIKSKNKTVNPAQLSSLSNDRRPWSKISAEERLRLESAVNFGLPVYFAGNILEMNSRNAARVMREQRQTRLHEE